MIVIDLCQCYCTAVDQLTGEERREAETLLLDHAAVSKTYIRAYLWYYILVSCPAHRLPWMREMFKRRLQSIVNSGSLLIFDSSVPPTQKDEVASFIVRELSQVLLHRMVLVGAELD